jgi:hypothetical protein
MDNANKRLALQTVTSATRIINANNVEVTAIWTLQAIAETVLLIVPIAQIQTPVKFVIMDIILITIIAVKS